MVRFLDPLPADPALLALGRSPLDLVTPKPAQLRLRTTGEEQIHCRDPILDAENGLLFLVTNTGERRELLTRDITGVWWRRPRVSVYSAVGAGVLALGASLGRYLTRGSDFPGDGLFLGILAAAFAAPIALWLMQDLPFMWRWESIYEKPAA